MSAEGVRHYRVQQNDQFGRYLEASKDLESGELIFEDTPFAVGPKPDTPLLCLGCYCPCDGSYACARCGWPCCGAACEAAPQHADYECGVFAAARVRFQPVDDATASCVQLDCITPLRILLEKERQPERWTREVATLETHSEARRERATWEADQVNVARFLVDHCHLADRFDTDLVQAVCGILEVNSVEVPARGGFSARAVYPQLSLVAHSCVPNIVHTITSDYRVVVRAAVGIARGSPLFLCYTHALAPTLARRDFLLQSKFFECACARCADRTELATHLGSLKCAKCDDGLILSTDPLNNEAGWKCTHCEFGTSAAAVRKIQCVVQAEVEAADELEPGAAAIELREQLLKKYRSAFHPRHSLLLGLKLSLAQLYGRVEGYELDELPDILLERKQELCRLVLQVLDVVTPGESRLRATMLYELHAPFVFLARSEYRAGVLDGEGLRARLAEPLRCLEAAERVLAREDPASAEGMLARVAADASRQLRDSLATL